MCDGQPADDCDFMNLIEFKTTLHNRLANLDEQFDTINNVLKTKKDAFIELYRKDPRISYDEVVSRLQTTFEAFNPTNPDEAEEAKRLADQLLADQKTQLEYMCTKLKERLNKEEEKSEKRLEANKNLRKSLEGQIKEQKVARQKLESENASLDKKLKILVKQEQIQFNDKLAKTSWEKTNLEQRLREKEQCLRKLQSSLSGTEIQNEELQSVLVEELKTMEKITIDLKTVIPTTSDVDAKILRLSELFQQIQARLKQTIVCESFSDDNVKVTISKCKRSVKGYIDLGYCFLNHPKIEQNQILKWCVRIPKFKGNIGMVIFLDIHFLL